MKKKLLTASLMAVIAFGAGAQERLGLQDCRDMAIQNNRAIEQAEINREMAHYDRAVARANYFPNISAQGTCLYNSMDVALIDDETSDALKNAGTIVQGRISDKMAGLQQLIGTNPSLAMEYMKSPLWQTFMGTVSQIDISQAINAVGNKVDNLLHPDVQNITLAYLSAQQPVFVGGKIIAANRIASLAESLAESQLNTEYQKTIVNVDNAYWQIVAIAAKKELAKSYADLLLTMDHDVRIAVEAGVATESDALSIKVKANEAQMMLTKATEGLKLAKMLLCQEIGLPLESEIMLIDEGTEVNPIPAFREEASFEEIENNRSELQSLKFASKIYDQKIKVARADMLPQIALTADYFMTNPSLKNGFSQEFNGFYTAGVKMKIPIFHGLEAQKKTQKAKSEAKLYHSKYDEAVEMVKLEIAQLKAQKNEAADRYQMSQNNLASAEENLRIAMVGFEEGVIEANAAMAAQTAWLQAHSEFIDAGIELQMIDSNLNRAEGLYKYEK